ncbi:MAG: phage baseplate assembly protein V [Cohaesibacter sp.]|nr:phage baseplate assembly protein V [Cohaesibacter sp.]
MSERFRNNEKNSPYRRGKVIERQKGRVKVKFGDEDDNDSYWLSVAQKGSGANKSWSMPNVGEQVACLMDWDGEDGCVIGSLFNDEDAAPTDDADSEHILHESGLEIIANRKTGNLIIRGFGSAVMEGSDLHITANVRVTGDFIADGGSFTHEGKNVGHDHKHIEVLKGPDKTGVPE